MLRKIMPLLFVLSFGLLAACTTTENYEAKLNTWVGKSEKELVMSWGVPDKQYQLDAHTKMLSYVSHQNVVYPGTFSPCVASVNRGMVVNSCGPEFPPTVESYHCETIFTLTDGKVTRWGHKGNNCRA